MDFVSAVRSILTGAPLTSVLWLDEPGLGGYFLDVVTGGPEPRIHIAVHDICTPDEDPTMPKRNWSAARGSVRFEAHASAEEFATACAAALRRVRTTQVDSTGLVTHWPHPFPQAEFERVERLAGQYPYTPKNALQGNI